MTGAEVLEAIRARHLKANISGYEGEHPDDPMIHWERAWLDTGGTIFGPGPYAKVPITFGAFNHSEGSRVVVRVYAPARLQRRLAAQWDGSRFPNGEPSDD